jgi:uncharacterized protein YlxW (UPF0749 family)
MKVFDSIPEVSIEMKEKVLAFEHERYLKRYEETKNFRKERKGHQKNCKRLAKMIKKYETELKSTKISAAVVTEKKEAADPHVDVVDVDGASSSSKKEE